MATKIYDGVMVRRIVMMTALNALNAIRVPRQTYSLELDMFWKSVSHSASASYSVARRDRRI